MTQEQLALLGAITGTIGSISGIAGAWIAYVSYRKTEQLKSIDLRGELGKLLVDLQQDIESLPAQIENADRSRERVTSAVGGRSSGAMQKWKAEVEADRLKIPGLNEALSVLRNAPPSRSLTSIQSSIVEAYRLQSSVRELQERYRSALAKDDQLRAQLHEDQRAQMQSRMQGKQ